MRGHKVVGNGQQVADVDGAGPAQVPSRDDALTLLAELGQEVEPGPLPGLVRPLLEVLAELSGLESVYLTSIDWEAGTQSVEIARNTVDDFTIPEDLSVAWDDTLCKHALREQRWWNADVPGTWGTVEVGPETHIQSFVSVPVVVDDSGQPIGTLCGASPREVEEDSRVVDVLRLFAQMIATSMQRDRALLEARARAAYAEERLAERIRFAAQVEHAMKSPITAIRGWAELLRERAGDDPDSLDQGLDAIERTANRLGDQVRDLLAEARATIGAGEVEDVDVRRVADGLDTLAPDHPYSVEGELHLRTDPVAVAVLLEHLVENAVTHTPVGTPIRVLLAPGRIVVEDDGPGLPERDDLFEPFVSADPEVAGTGLGLHIIGAIAERLGAEVVTGSSDAGGARFEVRFT